MSRGKVHLALMEDLVVCSKRYSLGFINATGSVPRT